MSRENSGYVVQTKSGQVGRTKHSDKEVNGKVPVYLDSGGKMLCSKEKLKMIGFHD